MNEDRLVAVVPPAARSIPQTLAACPSGREFSFAALASAVQDRATGHVSDWEAAQSDVYAVHRPRRLDPLAGYPMQDYLALDELMHSRT